MKRPVLIFLALMILFGTTSGCTRQEDANTVTEVKVTLPCSTGTRAVAEGEAVITTQLYLLSRAYFEKLETFDTVNFDAQEYSRLLAEAADAFRVTEMFCEALESHAEVLAKIEESGSAQSQQAKATCELLSAPFDGTRSSPFVPVVYAAEEKSPAVRYAEELTKTFDNAKNGQKLKAVAEKYGTDVKKAKVMLEQAQAILEGSAYEDQAAFENKCYEAAVTTKALASTAGFVCAVIATGGVAAGGASASGIIEAGNIVCGGLQAVIDTGSAATIYITNGEGNEGTVLFEKADEVLSPISTFFAIGDGVQNIIDFRDPAKAAEKVDKAAQVFLTGVGFVRDYVQDDKVLGVSSNIIDNVRQIVFRDADISDPEAVKEVLTKTGVSAEALENTAAAPAAAERTEGFGTAADTYIASLGGPVDPAAAEVFLESVDTVFRTRAEEEGASVPASDADTVYTEIPSVQEATEPVMAEESVPSDGESSGSAAAENNETAVTESINPVGDPRSADGVAGLYHFDGLDALVEAVDDTHLRVTDVNYGEVINGEYDASTGVFTAELSDRMSWTVTIAFKDTDGGILADYQNVIGGSIASASSAMKDGSSGSRKVLSISDVTGTYVFQGEGDPWTQIFTIVDDTHLMATDADDPEAVIIGTYDENTGVFYYSEGDETYSASAAVTFTDTGSGIKADMVLTINGAQAYASAVKQ